MNQDISTFDGVDDMLDTGVLFKNAVQDGFTHTIGHVELKVLGLQSACKNRSNRIGLELDAIPQPTTGRDNGRFRFLAIDVFCHGRHGRAACHCHRMRFLIREETKQDSGGYAANLLDNNGIIIRIARDHVNLSELQFLDEDCFQGR